MSKSGLTFFQTAENIIHILKDRGRTVVKHLMMCATASLVLAPLAAHADSPTLYASSERSTIDEFLTYDLAQNPFSTSGGYQPGTIAPVNADGLEGSIASIATTGNTLYGLSQRGNIDEFLAYDLKQNPFSTSSGYQPSTIAPINADGLEGSLSAIATTGNTLYALSQRGTIDEFLTYDLTQNPFSSSGGYQPSTIAPINAAGPLMNS